MKVCVSKADLELGTARSVGQALNLLSFRGSESYGALLVFAIPRTRLI